jgi:hypothetical protein
MAYELLDEKFHDIAFKETLSIIISNHPRLPNDHFGFLEAYCNDEDCDCRRVMFNVASRNRQEFVAVIAFGWESQEFYARWYRKNDPEVIRQLKGPILNFGSEQSDLAPALLELVRDTLVKDPVYIEQLKRHYRMFKERVDPEHFPTVAPKDADSRPVSKTRRRHQTRLDR